MLVLVSNFSLSQTTNTQNTNYISDAQLTQIYKGLKQGEYLKERVKKTEEVLEEANQIINQQKLNIQTKDEIIKNKNIVIGNLEFQIEKQVEISEAQKEQLNSKIKILEIQNKENGRKKFWTGFKIGGISVAVLGVTTLLLLK